MHIFKIIMKYEGGNIVKPIIPNENYSSIGLFYLKDGASLDYNSIGLLPNDMIVKLDEPIIPTASKPEELEKM